MKQIIVSKLSSTLTLFNIFVENMKKILSVGGLQIVLFKQNETDFISLTDIAKHKNLDDPRFVIQNWMRTRNSIEFL